MQRPLSFMTSAAMLVFCVAGGCFNPDPSKKLNSMPQGTGFILREVKNDAGTHKYSIFVPRDYNTSKKYPTIV